MSTFFSPHSSHLLPSSPDNRRVVYCLDGAGWERLINEGDREGILTDPLVTVLKVTRVGRQTQKIQKELDRHQLLDRGTVLGQSPYDQDSYWEIDKAKLSGSIEKFSYFMRLCQLIGARSVQVNEIVQTTEGSKHSFKSKLAIESYGGAGGFAMKEAMTLTSKIQMGATFGGWQRWRWRNQNKAYTLLKEKNLDRDSEFKRLVEMGLEKNNKIKDYEFTLDLTSDSSKNTDIFLSVNVPECIGDFKTKYLHNTQKSSDFTVKVSVIF